MGNPSKSILVAPKYVYTGSGNKQLTKAGDISMDLLNQKSVAPEDCPWVQINGKELYVSITITGEESWLPLVRKLYAAGKKKITVFTGRHGDIPNMVDNKTKETVGVFDPKHVKEDEGVKAEAKKELKDVTIDLVDCASNKKLQTEWLKKETMTRLKAGPVIYAWCYSLFTMCEGDADAAKVKTTPWDKYNTPGQTKVVFSAAAVETSKTVELLVKEGFGWVK